jgi:tRNA threonylcarbamoyladenosine modification (KEOPS) complex  Pcc1 subunit
MSTLNVEQAEAQIFLQMPEETADIVMKALKPEADTPSSDRSSTVIEKGFNIVTIRVSASDTTALRANVNSYLHWVQGIIDVVDKIK